MTASIDTFLGSFFNLFSHIRDARKKVRENAIFLNIFWSKVFYFQNFTNLQSQGKVLHFSITRTMTQTSQLTSVAHFFLLSASVIAEWSLIFLSHAQWFVDDGENLFCFICGSVNRPLISTRFHPLMESFFAQFEWWKENENGELSSTIVLRLSKISVISKNRVLIARNSFFN